MNYSSSGFFVFWKRDLKIIKRGSRKANRVGTNFNLYYMKKMFFIAFLSVVALVSSCKKSDSPAENDIFVGTYKGSVSFTKDGDKKSSDSGSVTVVKTGDSYYFRFSDGIENLSGVNFKRESETLVNVDFKQGVQYIKVTASSLSMLYMKDGKTWTADAKR